MKKSKYFFVILLAFVTIFFTGCPKQPDVVSLRSSKEIVAYMNKNFDGEFKEIESKIINEPGSHGIRVKMECVRDNKTFPVITVEFAPLSGLGCSNSSLATNYYMMFYSDEIKAKLKNNFDELTGSCFSQNDYKVVVNCNESCTSSQIASYKSLDAFLKRGYDLVSVDLILRGDFLNDKGFNGQYSKLFYDVKQCEDNFWRVLETYIVNTDDDISGLDAKKVQDKYKEYNADESLAPVDTSGMYQVSREYNFYHID